MTIESSDFGLFRDFPEAVFIIDPTGTILEANRVFADQFFSDFHDIRGLNIYELISSVKGQPELAASRREQIGKALETGKQLFFEDHDNGRDLRHSIYPVRFSEGEITQLLVIVQDITTHNQTERQNHKDNLVFRALLDAIPGAVFILDDEGLLAGCNEYAFSIFGNDAREIKNNNLLSFIHRDEREKIRGKFLKTFDSRTDEITEARMCIHGDPNDTKWFSIHARRASLGGQAYLVIVAIDIDERKQVEEALFGYKRWLNLAMEAADSGVWEWNVVTDELVWSDEIWHLHGLGKCEYKPSFNQWVSTVLPDDRDNTVNAVRTSAQNMADLNIEYRVLRPDDSVHWILSSGKPIFDPEGKVTRYCGTAIDVSEQKQIENELLRSRLHLDFALEKCHIGWWELNLANNSILRTLEHDRIFGYESLSSEWSFEKFQEHIVAEDRARVSSLFADAIENRRDYAFESRIISATGEIRWIWTSGTIQFDSNGRASHLLGIVQDITERKREEEELEKLQIQIQQSQKMELVGQLAGGIAHDFNNALTAILGNTELLLSRVDASSPLVEQIKDIESSAERSASLTRQLLAFARRQAATPKTLTLNREIENLLPMLRGLIGGHIRFIWKPSEKELSVHIDPSQLDQIIVNFCINSRDAIGESGTITIETQPVHITAKECANGHPCQMPGDYVRISVSDTGCGIDAKSLPHVFEPFFTTKEVGKGTGLGLSTVYGVLKQNRGSIDCQTTPGKGTTFNVYLPLHDTMSEHQYENSRKRIRDEDSKTILLVEDEPSILKILSGLLEGKGFTVLSAQDALTAIRMADQFPDEIDLLVTDIVLPDMNGVRLSDQLQFRRPGLKTLFMSGYAQEMMLQYSKLAEGLNFIQKPFAIKSFMEIVSRMMNNCRKIEARPYRASIG